MLTASSYLFCPLSPDEREVLSHHTCRPKNRANELWACSPLSSPPLLPTPSLFADLKHTQAALELSPYPTPASAAVWG